MKFVYDLEKKFHDCEGNTYIAINDYGRMLGRICTRRVSWFGTEFCHLFVKEEYRRQGVATFLNRELMKLNNKSIIIATVSNENIPSIKMMRSLGFSGVTDFISNISGKPVTLYLKKLDL